MSTLFLASSGLSALPQFTADPKATRLGFIATAAELEEKPAWIHRDTDALILMGYSVIDIALTGTGGDELENLLNRVDVLFVAGGNTYYLLQQMRVSGFDNLLPAFLARGGVYAGASAGAIVAGPDVDITAEPDQRSGAPFLRSTQGLGLVPYSVLPHSGSNEVRFVTHQMDVMSKYGPSRVRRVTDDEALVVQDGVSRIVWSPRSTL